MTVDRRIGDATLENGEVVVRCSCGGAMEPEMGGRLGEPSYLWWRCAENTSHLTRAIPVPARLEPR